MNSLAPRGDAPAGPELASTAHPTTTGASSALAVVRGLLETARPRQWIKNVLVLAAPGAAGVLTHLHALSLTLLALVAFSVAASGTYLINDAIDQEADRLHPRKRHRPVAAGVVPVMCAEVTGAVLLVTAVGGCLLLGAWQLAIVVLLYVAVTMSYCLWLKHEPVLDIAAVAAGFVLRAVAGGAAAQVPISNWFFIVVSFGALFMVAGKRHGENLELGTRSGEHRSTLAAYSDSFLRYVRGTCSAVAIAAYCLWASDRAGGGHAGLSWFEISIVPFVLAIFRYGLVVERGEAAAPEEVVLGDRVLQVLALLWVAVFALGVYLR